MKCDNCLAKDVNNKCVIDVKPYLLKTGNYGCTFNSATVRKRLKDKNLIPNNIHWCQNKFLSSPRENSEIGECHWVKTYSCSFCGYVSNVPLNYCPSCKIKMIV